MMMNVEIIERHEFASCVCGGRVMARDLDTYEHATTFHPTNFSRVRYEKYRVA